MDELTAAGMEGFGDTSDGFAVMQWAFKVNAMLRQVDVDTLGKHATTIGELLCREIQKRIPRSLQIWILRSIVTFGMSVEKLCALVEHCTNPAIRFVLHVHCTDPLVLTHTLPLTFDTWCAVVDPMIMPHIRMEELTVPQLLWFN